MRLDALFVRAPQILDEPASYAILPEGIQLVTILNKNGVKSLYYSADFLGFSRKIRAYPSHLRKRILDTDEEKRKFLNLSHPKWHKMREVLKKHLPKVVIIYPHKSYDYTGALLAAETVKKTLPNVKTIIWNVLGIYDYFISSPYVDFVVKGNFGDTEYITLSLVRKIINNEGSFNEMPNIIYRKENRTIHTPTKIVLENLDNFPIPDRDFVVEKNYYPRFAFGWIEGPRGCIHKCNYCRMSTILAPIRVRSPEKVVLEIMQIYTKYHTREFYFYTSSFTMIRKWAEKVCDLIKEKKLDIIFQCYSSPDEINERLIRKMRKAGCFRIGIGVENANSDILRLMNRKISIEKVKKASRIIKKNKINLETTTIIGYPGESIKDIYNSILFTLKLRPDGFAIPIFIPHPELSITQILKKEGKIIDENFLEYYSSQPKVKLDNVDLNMLREIFFRYNDISYRLEKIQVYKSLLNIRYLKAKLVEKSFDIFNRLLPLIQVGKTSISNE